jgi:hypothetical protein
MKLAEALNARADAQKRLQQIRQRVQASARHQEGEEPPEDPGSCWRRPIVWPRTWSG